MRQLQNIFVSRMMMQAAAAAMGKQTSELNFSHHECEEATD